MSEKIKQGTKPFEFKQFTINQEGCAMKVGTDGILLGAMLDIREAKTILDIGAGSGLIAIMLAQRTTDSLIHAVEIDDSAFAQASHNMAQSPWTDRLSVFHSSIQEYAFTGETDYDLIVSNPPFFSGGTFSRDEDRNNVRHTVKLPNGDLLNAARKLLSADGRFCVILPYIEGLRFKEQAEQYGFYCVKTTEILGKKEKPVERLFLQFERKSREMEANELVIYNSDNTYSAEYIALTQMFYRDM